MIAIKILFDNNCQSGLTFDSLKAPSDKIQRFTDRIEILDDFI